MKLLDLFSGIGGFSLAAQRCGIETVAFCEIDSFCQKVLNKNFPGIEIYSDIKELKGNEITEKYGAIDIICGGFPCQPFSVAGKRKGKEDDRYLWPEMLRVISEVKPSWVIGENVAGIVNMELDKVCIDLENKGYEVQPFIIPACAVNAPHRRDRVWIIAHSYNTGTRGEFRKISNENEKIQKWNENPEPINTNPKRIGVYASSFGLDKRELENNGSGKNKPTDRPSEIYSDVTNPHGEYSEKSFGRDKLGFERKEIISGRSIYESDWERNWIEVATELCGIHDGLSVGVHRINRIKALGNSIVPQVAYEILKSIQEIENAA